MSHSFKTLPIFTNKVCFNPDLHFICTMTQNLIFTLINSSLLYLQRLSWSFGAKPSPNLCLNLSETLLRYDSSKVLSSMHYASGLQLRHGSLDLDTFLSNNFRNFSAYDSRLLANGSLMELLLFWGFTSNKQFLTKNRIILSKW